VAHVLGSRGLPVKPGFSERHIMPALKPAGGGNQRCNIDQPVFTAEQRLNRLTISSETDFPDN
jgi:hypothetical protein